MRRLLIISPHFCPVNAADMQRVRLALPHLRSFGWEPTVLALDPTAIEAPVLDPLLEKTYPPEIRVVRVHGIPPKWTRALGFGGLWWRTRRAFADAGAALLAKEKFDLLFFSTTQFDFMGLAPQWSAAFGVPYVLDYQDPWVNDYYRRTGVPPPGGPLRHAFSSWRSSRMEPRTLRGAAGVISVSPTYVDALVQRYRWFDAQRALVLPFGASTTDFALARECLPVDPLVPHGDGLRHIVSTGRAGADLAPGLRLLFAGLARLRHSHPAAAERLRLHFIGTSYAPAGLARPSVAPLAEEAGVGDLVNEHPARVPYFEALHYLSRADGILTLGSDDPGYTPSKLAPVLMAGRPVLAVLHAASPALEFARAANATVACLANAETVTADQARIASWLAGEDNPVPDQSAVAGHDLAAEAMSRRLTAFFDSCLIPPSALS